ncbi:MAG: 16S rRNA (cytosine(1402)-N(4))-methyltransferase RsmH [Clostridia bacterium]
MEEHKRRIRYKGTHPHIYQEKYKELNPTQYADEIAKTIEKGKTPAGMHIPILVDEILEFLHISSGQVGLDATLGYGGHSQRMLESLQGRGHLYAIDIDGIELEKTKSRLAELGYGDDVLTVSKLNFSNIDQLKPQQKFDFVLADLGVSSMQIDNPERGFTFKHDGKLDLRLDSSSGQTASERLKELNYMDLVSIFTQNADEPYAEQIAKVILRTFKKGGVIDTTRQLYSAVEEALSFLPTAERKDTIKKSCQRVFQALRIDINSEFDALTSFLNKLPSVLNANGKVAILTFHSGEDRLVKKAFKIGLNDGVYSQVARDVIRPSIEECNKNPRAHSTKMRWAIKS